MKKKVLYIHQYFTTPDQAGGTRSYWFAKHLVKNNYDVTVLTSRNRQDKFYEQDNVAGVKVIYVQNPYSNNMSIPARLLSFIKFMCYGLFAAWRLGKFNLVFATSTPLSIGIIPLILRKSRLINYVFEVRDLWPEVPIQMGGITNPILVSLTKIFEKLIYENSLHVIALSPGMEGGVRSAALDVKTSMIPNMSKIDRFYPRAPNIKLAKKYAVDLSNLNVVHFGAMGRANGLDYILDSAILLQTAGLDDIDFYLVGDGSERQRLESKVKRLAIKNISFIAPMGMEDLSAFVNLCSCSIITFKNLPILQTNSPNKLFDSLSAALPIIVNSAGWTKDIVENYSCGAYVDPTQPHDLSELLAQWKNNHALRDQMSANSRKLAVQKYDKSIMCEEFIKVIRCYV
jgi:glycosyltransferase involved in cell wall biosynthesis